MINDIVLPATPKHARRLVSLARIFRIDLPPSVRDLSKRDAVEGWEGISEVEQRVCQKLDDCDLRALVTIRSEQDFDLVLRCVEHLTGTPPIVVSPARAVKPSDLLTDEFIMRAKNETLVLTSTLKGDGAFADFMTDPECMSVLVEMPRVIVLLRSDKGRKLPVATMKLLGRFLFPDGHSSEVDPQFKLNSVKLDDDSSNIDWPYCFNMITDLSFQ